MLDYGAVVVAVGTIRSGGKITEKNIGRVLERPIGNAKRKLKLIFWEKPSSCTAGATLPVLTSQGGV